MRLSNSPEANIQHHCQVEVILRARRHLVEKCVSINNTIRYLFDILDNMHGKVFLSHVFFYMAALDHAISEQEIEDILSIDDEQTCARSLNSMLSVHVSILTHMVNSNGILNNNCM